MMSDSETARIPPQAVNVEMAVLGAILFEKEAIAKALDVLDTSCFYKSAHQKIYEAMIALFERNEPIDIVTVTEQLRRQGMLEVVGGTAYITALTENITSAANIEQHAYIILEKSLMRDLIAASFEIGNKAYNPAEDALDLLDEAETRIFQISEKRLKRTFTPLNQVLTETLEILNSIHGKHGGVTGVPTGFYELDNITGGFQKSDLIIIAGRPSQGKTALALSLARNAALHEKRPTAVGIFSLEMSETQLATRLLAYDAKVNAHSLRTGRLPQEQWRNLTRAASHLAQAKIFIDDTPSLGILELRAKSRRLKVEHGAGLIIVDYLQLISGPKNIESREREVALISRSLKSLAKELSCPVVALSQLNRQLETRADKRPMLADLRESGGLEQDADVVMFVHRPETFGIEEIKDDEGNIYPTEGLAEIIIAKQRNGPTGVVRLAFKKEYSGFERLAPLGLAPVDERTEEIF